MTKKTFLKLRNKYRVTIYLFLVITLAFYFRTFNINWDENYYFHPDERAIIMYASTLQFPTSIEEFFSISSPLNPHFFAYGSFPLYLIKTLGTLFSFIDNSFAAYGGMHIVGRLVSALSDTVTVFFVFILGSQLFNKRAGVFGSFLYAVSVFPIQTSHFFAVDTLLTFFMTATVIASFAFLKHPTPKKALLIGVCFGFALATKISSLILLPFLLLVFASTLNNKREVAQTIKDAGIFTVTTILIFFLSQPYAAIDFENFLRQTTLQSQMGSDPFVFPYTLQYVSKVPYLYELKNIFLFGQGPILSLICFSGVILVIYKLFSKQWKKNILLSLFVIYTALYFLIFGRFAVGWMRYMLPLYPIFAVFGGYLLSHFYNALPSRYIKNYFFKKSVLILLALLLLLYPFSFISIYMAKNTRIQASDWINKNIPIGQTLAIEHWDDALPVYGGQNYQQITLPLYDPDTADKWIMINNLLDQSDYVVIASNRLYTPLQKLTACKKLPIGKCYPLTSSYYNDLFSGKLGFEKVAEFSRYPTIPFTNIHLNDQGADESFTVYDHPKVMIFKKKQFKE